MDTQFWTFFWVGLSFAIYIGIALWTRAGSTKEFYVAGGGVPPIANGMATGADWMSAASFISMAGLISVLGYDGSMYLMGWTGGYVLLALLLAPYLRKFGKFTVPDFVGDRYYSQIARQVSVFCAIFISFTYVAGQMRGVGVVFSRFLGLSIEMGVVVGMILVLLYATLGGMKGITYTQVAQYVVLIIAYLIPAIFISIQMTGIFLPQLGFGATLTDGSGMYLLDKLDKVNTDLGFAAYTKGSKSMLDILAITMALMVGTAGLPHVIVRFYTVPKASDARISAGWALIFIALLYTTAPALGSFTRMNILNTLTKIEDEGGKRVNKGVDYASVPEWFKNWEKTKLIKFEDKQKDGKIYFEKSARSNVTIDNDIIVLATPEIAKLPGWVVGLVAAGGLAAALSTAAGLLLVISTSISHDLIKKMINPDISEKNELLAARGAAAVAVVVAGYFGINPPGFVAQVVAFAFGLAASSFFPIIIMGIFYKKANKEGAIIGMLSGIVFTAAYIIYFKFMLPPAENVAKNWLFGISPEGIGTIGMLINFIIIFVVSKITPEPPKEVQELVENIRVPRGTGDAQSH